MKYGKKNKKNTRLVILAVVLLNIMDFHEYFPVSLYRTVVTVFHLTVSLGECLTVLRRLLMPLSSRIKKSEKNFSK